MKFSMKFAPSFSFGPAPVFRSEEHRHLRGMEIVGERAVGAQRLLQFVDREAGIGGEEGAHRVDGLQHHFAAAAAAHAEAEDAQQLARRRRFAGLDLDDLAIRRPAFPVRAPAKGSGAPASGTRSAPALRCCARPGSRWSPRCAPAREECPPGWHRARSRPCARRSAAVPGCSRSPASPAWPAAVPMRAVLAAARRGRFRGCAPPTPRSPCTQIEQRQAAGHGGGPRGIARRCGVRPAACRRRRAPPGRRSDPETPRRRSRPRCCWGWLGRRAPACVRAPSVSPDASIF